MLSESGKGSTFRFYVPTQRCAAAQDERELPNIPQLPDQATSSTNGHANATDLLKAVTEHRRVLIVEDNLVNQQLLAKLLKKNGCECTVANDGQEAIDKIRASGSCTPDNDHFFDCVLMDIEVGLTQYRGLSDLS